MWRGKSIILLLRRKKSCDIIQCQLSIDIKFSFKAAHSQYTQWLSKDIYKKWKWDLNINTFIFHNSFKREKKKHDHHHKMMEITHFSNWWIIHTSQKYTKEQRIFSPVPWYYSYGCHGLTSTTMSSLIKCDPTCC